MVTDFLKKQSKLKAYFYYYNSGEMRGISIVLLCPYLEFNLIFWIMKY